MADTATTFSDYFVGLPNPFVPRDAQFIGFAAIPAIQPQAILASLESTQYPSVLLATREDGTPALFLAPFSAATLPGVAPPAHKYAFYGDFSQAGNPPALLMVTANFFHLSGNTTVLETNDVAAAWTTAPAGTIVLPPPVAGANTEQVQTRNSMPVPHEYSQQTIAAFSNGTLSWEWLWTNVAVPILADAQQSVDYLPFVTHLRASFTQRAPAAAGGLDRVPATALEISATATTPNLQDRAMSKAREFLPGLRQPVGVGAQLNALAQQQLVQNTALANAQQDRPITMARKAPALLSLVQLINEVPVTADESELAPFWLQFPGTPTGRWMGALKSVILRLRSQIAAEGGPLLAAPILTVPFVTDVGEGNFFAEDMEDVTSGLSVFRARPANSINADSLTSQNRMYTLLVSGTGVAQASTVQMLVTNKEIEIPTDPFIFGETLEGYYLIMRAVCGRHNRAVTNLYNAVIRDVNELARQMQKTYREPARFAYAALLVETWIFCKMNTYITDLLSSPAPAAIGGGTAIPPTFAEIRESIKDGNLMFLTGLPEAIATHTSTHEPAERPLPPALRELNEPTGIVRSAGAPGNTTGATGRAQIAHPEWNENLKRAWTSLGTAGLYVVGSPFRDETQPNKKRVVPSDTHGKRICLAMALNGVCYSNCNGLHECLSDREVRRVAEVGGLTLE